MTPIPATPIETRAEFRSAVRAAFARAAAAGSAEIWLVDNDFSDWPLGEPAVVEQLGHWAASRRRLTLIASTFDEVARRHPRWVAWRRPWSHIVSCRCPGEVEPGALPTLLLASGTLSIFLSDSLRHRGRLSMERADELRCREQVDALLQRSVEVFPATATGL